MNIPGAHRSRSRVRKQRRKNSASAESENSLQSELAKKESQDVEEGSGRRRGRSEQRKDQSKNSVPEPSDNEEDEERRAVCKMRRAAAVRPARSQMARRTNWKSQEKFGRR